MSRILVLKSSFMLEKSLTNKLIDHFLNERKKLGFDDEVIEHELNTLNLPEMNVEIFNALRGEVNTKEEIKNIVALSDDLIKELKNSDLLLIGAPMYNLNVPTQLKNWFDLVARARVTFRYTETYPLGLIEGVKSIVFSSRGGIHLGKSTDAVTSYLNSVLGLIGINDIQFIYAEGIDMQPNGKEIGYKNAINETNIMIGKCNN